MKSLLPLLVCTVLLVFSGTFQETYYIPKLLALFSGGLAAAALMLQREELHIPSSRVLIFISASLALFTGMVILSDFPRHAFLQLLYILSGILIYFAALNADERGGEAALWSICGIALLQIGVILFQAAAPYPFLPATLIPVEGRLTGTIGNPEFLATVLGTAFFLLLHLREKHKSPWHRRLLAAGAAMTLAGIILLVSKGTLLFLALYWLWRRSKKIALVAGGAAAFIAVVYLLSPASILGRIFLWYTSLHIFAHNPIAGVGLGQFENSYLQAVHSIFSASPGVATIFGGYTSLTQDAHNLFLHNAAELGLPGLVFSIIFAVFAFRRARNTGYQGAAIMLLLYKSMYTVMLNSPTSLLLLALLLGVTEGRERLRSVQIGPAWTPVAIPLLAALVLAGTHFCVADLHYHRGVKSMAMGNSTLAEREFKRAAAIDPERAEPYLALAYLDFLGGRPGEMELWIRQAIERKKSMDTYKISAHMLFYSRLYSEAENIYSYLHFLFPEHLTSIAKLAVIAMQHGNRKEAALLAEKILASNPRRSNASDAKNLRIAGEILRKCSGGTK